MFSYSRLRIWGLGTALIGLWSFGMAAEMTEAAPGRIFRRSKAPARTVQQTNQTQRQVQPVRTIQPQQIVRQPTQQQVVRQVNYVRPTTTLQSQVRTIQPIQQPATAPQIARQVIPMNLDAFCEQVKTNVRKPSENDLLRCKNRLIGTANNLTWALAAGANRGANAKLRNDIKLDDLLKTLSDPNGPDDNVLDTVWTAMNSNDVQQNAGVFKNLKNEIRRYQAIKAVQDGESYEKQLANVCDNLSKYIQEYSKNTEPAYGTALTDVVNWLSDVSIVHPQAQALANSALGRISQPNLRVNASQRFISVPFNTSRTERVDVNNMINGTHVVGSGSVTANSQGVLVPRSNGAEIAIVVNGALNTVTSGRQSIVSLNTQATGSLRGEKRVQIFPNYIGVTSATAGANLSSQIYNVRVAAGPIVTCIAKKQVAKRKGGAEAIARENARQQFAGRLNQQVDGRIARLNQNYQAQLRQPLIQSGLYPRIFSLSSSNTHLNAAFLVGDSTQPGAVGGAPLYRHNYDVFAQCHQSAANNLATLFLAGKTFDEETVSANSNSKQFPELSNMFKRDPDQPPLTVEFAEKNPVAVTFFENKVKGIVRIDSFVQDGTKYPGLDITLLYNVKMEIDNRNCVHVVFEQADTPQAFPRGFDPNQGRKLSARHQAIRTIVMKRLDNALPKRFVAKSRPLQGEYAGRGVLAPVFATTQGGWINMAWNWVPYR